MRFTNVAGLGSRTGEPDWEYKRSSGLLVLYDEGRVAKMVAWKCFRHRSPSKTGLLGFKGCLLGELLNRPG
jgi:hypothetical protein